MLLLLFVLASLTATAFAQDTKPAVDDSAARALLKRLPKTSSLAIHGDRVRWGGAEGFAVRVERRSAFLDVPLDSTEQSGGKDREKRGSIEIDPGCFLGGDRGVAKLREFLATRKKEGLKGATHLRYLALVGLTLSDRGARSWFVTKFGILRAEKVAPPPDATLALFDIHMIAKGLEINTPNRAAEQTIRRVLHCLNDIEKDEKNEFGPQIPPGFARQLVTSGWLDDYVDDPAELRKAVAAAEKLRVARRFVGAGHTLEFLASATGRRGAILSGPKRSGYVTHLPEAAYNSADPRKELIVDFPPGSDPRQSIEKAIAAEVRISAWPLAKWSAEDGFTSSSNWRLVIPRQRGKAVKDQLPPHVLMMGLDGRIDRLITAHGTLRSAKDGSAAEAERFLGEAANALPGAAHLDLIGEYLFHYVYDSPDPSRPLLLGNPKVHGEIHQTAEQTIATVTAGVCRGDCDDLAELYHDILLRQGKLAQLLSLPAHSALGFVEKQEDGKFHSYVLQTGTPLEFVGDDVESAIVATYKQFYPSVTADALPVSYRFAGENVRSDWVLGYRIFGDKNYADTMRDVQRDWHYHTYRQGVAKMESLVKSGDHDAANYRELAGLARQTAQWKQQIAMLEEARKRTDATDHEGLDDLALDEIFALIQSGKAKQAIARTEEMIAPRENARPEDEANGLEGKLRLVTTLVLNDVAPLTALDVLDNRLSRYVALQIKFIGRYIENPRFDRQLYLDSPEVSHMRDIMSNYVETAIATLDSLRSSGIQLDETQQAAAKRIEEAAAMWLSKIAFHDVVAKGAELDRYATAGRIYQLQVGREAFWKELDATSVPAAPLDNHRQRRASATQRAKDLPWIKISIHYWTTELMTLFQSKKPLDGELVQALQGRLEKARDRAAGLGILNEFDRRSTANCALYAAMLRDDTPTVRKLLSAVRELGDKYFRDDATTALGQIARRVSVEQFGKMLRIWHEEVHHKPAYFQIVWDSFVHGAKKQAKHAARFAVECFPKDKPFVEELAFLEALAR